MKKILYHSAALLMLMGMPLAATSCSDDDNAIEPFVNIVDNQGRQLTSLSFGSLASEEAVNVESNVDWTVSLTPPDASWLTISPASGKASALASIAVAENKTLLERSAKYEFVSQGVTLASFTVKQAPATPSLKVVPSTNSLTSSGGEVKFAVTANTTWTYSVTGGNPSEVSKTPSELVLLFPPYTQQGKITHKVTFAYQNGNVEVEIQQEGTKAQEAVADLLDIEFLPDGTAKDLSPFHHTVITNPSNALMTYYNSAHQRYVANFRHSMGASVTEGYYRVNYPKGGEFINKIADGCTFETMIKLNSADNPTTEVKWFSSMQGGGIGFILPIHSRSKAMTFLPNVSTTGSSNWRWTHSSVAPEPGVYYHVVGVYNKDEGKSYIYINGELSGTQSCPGAYVPVAAGAESFVIGGDAEPNQTVCASAWDGEIVTARIYDDPMDAAQVSSLWELARFDASAAPIAVNNLEYIPACQVAPGCKYSIYGNGFQPGDAVELQSVTNQTKYQPATTVVGDRLTVTIPSGLVSDRYKLILIRSSAQAPLVQVDFTVSANPVLPTQPKIIAHRGAHTDGASENSIAALTKAMDADYFGIELDVWITTDNQLVVHHDGVVNGVRFDANAYSSIKDITLSNGEKLPTFDSFVETFKRKMDQSSSKLIIEIKSHSQVSRTFDAVDKVMDMVAAAGIAHRVEYIAFNYDACKRIVQKDPNAMVGFLNGSLAPATVMADGIKSVDYSASVYNNNPTWIADALKLGMVVNVWTINSAADMLKFATQGVHYITTDQPALLRQVNSKVFVEL